MRLRYTALLTLPLVAACGLITRPPTPGTARGPGSHSVSYTVRCEQCRVTYSTGLGMAEAEAKGLWTKTLSLTGSGSGSVVLTAFPTTSAAMVRHAYIEIDGKKVAETHRETRNGFSDQVTLTARLPDFPGGVGSRQP